MFGLAMGVVMKRFCQPTLLVLLIGLTLASCTSRVRAQEYRRSTFMVKKLVCRSCLALIETDLKKVPGVVGMGADLRTATVSVDHTAQIAGQQLAERITGLGYPATLAKQEVVAGGQVQRFTNSFATCGIGGCRTGGCNATASAWKQLYRKYIQQ